MRALPLLAALLAAGCVESDETVTLLPDGSGKLHLKLALKKAAIVVFCEEMKRRGEDIRPDALLKGISIMLTDPEILSGLGEGVVAWKTVPVDDRDGWIRATLTAYFDDLNRVRIRTFDEDLDAQGRPKLMLAGRMSTEGAGGRATLTTHLAHAVDDMKEKLKAGRAGGAERAALELLKPAFQELKIAIRVRAPGPIEGAKGFSSTDGRAGTLELDGGTMLGLATDPGHARVRLMEEAARGLELRWGSTTATEEEIRAFKAELETAKADWARLRGRPAPAAKAPPAAPERPRSLASDADRFTDDEVDRLFIEAQLKIAREQIDRGQKDKARATLEGVLKDFPKAKAAQEAKSLLERLK